MSIGTTSNMEWLSGPGGSGSVEYTAGNGIDIDNTNHVISVDTTEVQEKLTAGENITISNNVISANPQRQSDWNQSDSDAVDYIRNKPQNLVQDASYVHTDNNFTNADANKLGGIESGAEVNVQSDWAVSDSSSDAFIKNKPTIPSGDQLVPSATSSDEGKILTVDSNGDPSWAPAQTYSQVQSNWNETDSSAVSYIRNKPSIPTATSDLTNDSNFITSSDVPSAQVQSDWTESDTSSAAYIAHKPTIPTVDQSYSSSSTNAQSGVAVSQAISAVNQVPSSTSADDGKILTVDSNGDPSWAPAQTYSQVQSNWNETDSSAVSFIRNKPTIPTKTSDLTNDSNFITANDVPSSQVQSDWTESDTSSAAYIAHKPSLATVATSGSYTDLSNKPSIPTKTSDLTNDSNFITASDIPAQVQSDWTESNSSSAAYIAHKPNLATVATSGSYSDLSGKPTIPSGNQLLPSATSADSGKVLTVDSTGSPEWATSGGSTQVQSNWTEVNTSNPAYIQNKPTVKNLIAGTGIRITETAQGIVISLA